MAVLQVEHLMDEFFWCTFTFGKTSAGQHLSGIYSHPELNIETYDYPFECSQKGPTAITFA